MIIPKEIEEAISRMAADGASHEVMVAEMRTMGLSKPHSMALLRNVTSMTLGEAKKAVHFSPTWSDRRVADEEFEENLYRTAIRAGLVEEEDPALERVA
jgi:ribosomal protein L7/L12